jgi:hypothetical protein
VSFVIRRHERSLKNSISHRITALESVDFCLSARETTSVAFLVGVSPVMVSLAAVALGCIALVGATLSVRCPSCGLNLAWYAPSKQAYHSWLSWLLDIKVCPRRGFSHSANQGGGNG